MLDMGKAWDGIHFLLTSQKAFTYNSPKRGERYLPPLESIVVGGTPFDHPDLDIAYFTSEQTVEIADALRDRPVEFVKESFDLASFRNARLYFFDQYLPATHKDSEEIEEILDEELFQYYEEMIEFFNEAVQSRDSILLYMG
ncbi:MAG: DUF1877 family protein [Leptolyngbyaceae cyanobacterium bins.302]|nr:DUF1877 family protein [Leptolyngbyaceae cyanobacterium bins.302]